MYRKGRSVAELCNHIDYSDVALLGASSLYVFINHVGKVFFTANTLMFNAIMLRFYMWPKNTLGFKGQITSSAEIGVYILFTQSFENIEKYQRFVLLC